MGFCADNVQNKIRIRKNQLIKKKYLNNFLINLTERKKYSIIQTFEIIHQMIFNESIEIKTFCPSP